MWHSWSHPPLFTCNMPRVSRVMQGHVSRVSQRVTSPRTHPRRHTCGRPRTGCSRGGSRSAAPLLQASRVYTCLHVSRVPTHPGGSRAAGTPCPRSPRTTPARSLPPPPRTAASPPSRWPAHGALQCCSTAALQHWTHLLAEQRGDPGVLQRVARLAAVHRLGVARRAARVAVGVQLGVRDVRAWAQRAAFT